MCLCIFKCVRVSFLSPRGCSGSVVSWCRWRCRTKVVRSDFHSSTGSVCFEAASKERGTEKGNWWRWTGEIHYKMVREYNWNSISSGKTTVRLLIVPFTWEHQGEGVTQEILMFNRLEPIELSKDERQCTPFCFYLFNSFYFLFLCFKADT